MSNFNLRTLLLATVAAGGLAVPAAHAQSASDSWLNSFLTRPTMTGDWNGGRTRLLDAGVLFHAFYDGNFADAMSGGHRTGNGYAQQLGFGVDLDTAKLFGLEGGTIHIGFNQRQGRSVSADFIGNRLAVQEVYGAGETLRVTELSYEQKIGTLVDFKGGFFPMGNDFAATPLGCDFMNVGFCAHPQSLPASSGWSDYPTGKWGGDIKLTPTPALYIESGVFDVNPGYYAQENGLKMSTSQSTGALIPVELGYTANLDGLTGHYKLGAYWDTSKVGDVITSSEIQSGRYGFYALADQYVMHFDNDPKRGLIVLGQVSYSDPSTALFQGTLVGALIAQGPFAARPADFANIGYVRAVLNGRKLNHVEATTGATNLSTGEGVLEVGYGFQATPWLLIHPNVQYIMNPGTFSYKHVANAWAFGAQVKAFF